MGIPSYKQVHIRYTNKLEIYNQLKAFQFGKNPYIFIITHLEKQQEAIQSLENYFIEYDIESTPYPIFILANQNVNSSIIEVVQSMDQVPQFFHQKVKTPNIKEQAVLAKLDLKKENLSKLRSEDYNPILRNYSSFHKEIYELTREANFYETILKKMEDKNAKR